MFGAPENSDLEQAGGERRWPMATAVIAMMVFTVLRPADMRIFPPWVLPAAEGALLLALVLGDPGRISKRSSLLRGLSILLVSLLALDSLVATVQLVDALVHGGQITQSADNLLEAGGIVWISNVLAFSLLYWELDDGGPAERVYKPRKSPDLAFPQELSPEVTPPGWQPQFVDYFYLGVTNATAFSPTDVMPLVPWAKMAMATQGLASFTIVGLVVARAVNAFS